MDLNVRMGKKYSSGKNDASIQTAQTFILKEAILDSSLHIIPSLSTKLVNFQKPSSFELRL